MTKDLEWIEVRGARTHNLRDLTLSIPRGKLTVVTGVSGSGKSSLAFDTLYAEGQRRYVESLSTYARQVLDLMPRPDVDEITGLSPAIAIEQKSSGSNPRSTVGTSTEIADYLRLLFARAGVPYCPRHGLPLSAEPIASMVEKVLALPEGTKILVLAPVARGRIPSLKTLVEPLVARGFMRFRIDGEVTVFETSPSDAGWDAEAEHVFEVVVDRLKVRPDQRERLSESFETAASLADGRTAVLDLEAGELMRFSSRYACPECDYTAGELEPRHFSANNPAGCCPHCQGTGRARGFDPAKVVCLPEAPVGMGAISGWEERNARNYEQLLALSHVLDFDVKTRWIDLPENVKRAILYGDERTRSLESPFEGVITAMERFWNESESPLRRGLERFRSEIVCPVCGGSGLGELGRNVRLGTGPDAKTIVELGRMPLERLREALEGLHLEGVRRDVAERILAGIKARLGFLCDVGVGYLSLMRRSNTLSGGESQRIRLASQIGSGLTGVLYVLDEPSIGLHPRDNARLVRTLEHLRDLGNTVLVVEHDEETMRAADWLVDMGPGAGEHGGRLLAAGTPEDIMRSPESITGRYLRGELRVVRPERRPFEAEAQPWLRLLGARGHNLKGVDLKLPCGRLTVVTGPSGSGKSSLVLDTLFAALNARLNRAEENPLPFDAIEGIEHFDKVIGVDQSPIGRTPRSNPATYTGLFSLVRDVFAQTQTARERGYDARRFSFNVKGGRCEACQGDGVVRVEMQFLPDMYVTCEVCGGERYNRETLECRYRGRTIAEVLRMTVTEALEFFSAWPQIVRRLEVLEEVGLGYLRLGQSATTLSGGEAQRVKLATELSRTEAGRTLYVLDEPTTGLHFADVEMLLKALDRLCERGNTVLVIEHNADVIRAADWVVDVGPEGGEAGGRIVSEGTPEDVAADPASVTGPYLVE